MSEKRMFSSRILMSDAYHRMDPALRCLYVTLGLEADDDGFVGSPTLLAKAEGLGEKDLLELQERGYIHLFDSGVAVILHWHVNNSLRADRRRPTIYEEEMACLTLDDKGRYHYAPDCPADGCPKVKEQKEKENKRNKNNAQGSPAAQYAAFAGEDEELAGLLSEFEQMRRSLGKPLTGNTRRMILEKLGGFPRDQQAAVLKQSVLNCWADLYPLRAGQKGKGDIPETPPGPIDMDRLRRMAEQL